MWVQTKWNIRPDELRKYETKQNEIMRPYELTQYETRRNETIRQDWERKDKMCLEERGRKRKRWEKYI